MQENERQKRILTVIGYYKNLTKKEKSKFLQYLCTNFGFMQNTIRTKVSGVNPMREYELKVCEDTINNEYVWRM